MRENTADSGLCGTDGVAPAGACLTPPADCILLVGALCVGAFCAVNEAPFDAGAAGVVAVGLGEPKPN